jgi:hypothetical protein
MADITPEDVNRLTKPTDGFLCNLGANHYNIEFLSFVISDYDTKNTIFEVRTAYNVCGPRNTPTVCVGNCR